MAFLAVQPVVYLVAWILLHVKGARENRAFIYPLYAFESMLSQYPLAGSDLQNRCITDPVSAPSPKSFRSIFWWHPSLPDRAS